MLLNTFLNHLLILATFEMGRIITLMVNNVLVWLVLWTNFLVDFVDIPPLSIVKWWSYSLEGWFSTTSYLFLILVQSLINSYDLLIIRHISLHILLINGFSILLLYFIFMIVPIDHGTFIISPCLDRLHVVLILGIVVHYKMMDVVARATIYADTVYNYYNSRKVSN